MVEKLNLNFITKFFPAKDFLVGFLCRFPIENKHNMDILFYEIRYLYFVYFRLEIDLLFPKIMPYRRPIGPWLEDLKMGCR